MYPKMDADRVSAQRLSPVEMPPVFGQVAAEEEQRSGPSQVEPDWRERIRPAVSFLVVLTFIVLAIVFVFAHGSVTDPDIWWHLHNADYLVQHHALPRYDMYSFTVPGHPWINHEWLAELPYYFGWRVLGLRGIDAVTFAVLSLIFLGLLYLCYLHSGHYKAAVVASCYSVFLASVSFGPRTILFGYAYLVVLLIVLQNFRRKNSGLVWLIPPLFCLWVNTHGSWLIGLIMFSMVIVGGLFEGQWGAITAEPWTPSQRNKLLLAWCASVGALFVNPFGWRLVFYPFDLAFRQKLNIEHVAEWVSVNFHDMRGKIVLILLIALLISAWLRSCRWTLAELGLLMFALYSGLTYIRFLFLLGIVAAPVVAKILDFVPRYRRGADTPVFNAFVILLIIGGVAHFWPREAQLQAALSQQYPVEAVAYLEAHPPQGPMLNFYLWGGYLNWRDPSVKVFLDSRVDIFEYTGVLKDYLDLLALNHPEPLLDKYGIRYVLFPPGEPLTYVLEDDSGWRVLYRDRISVLLERTSDHSAGIVPNEKNAFGGTGNSQLAATAAP